MAHCHAQNMRNPTVSHPCSRCRIAAHTQTHTTICLWKHFTKQFYPHQAIFYLLAKGWNSKVTAFSPNYAKFQFTFLF